MLNKKQSEYLEKLQFSALKIIFGYDLSKEKLIEAANIPTLQSRRETLWQGSEGTNHRVDFLVLRKHQLF